MMERTNSRFCCAYLLSAETLCCHSTLALTGRFLKVTSLTHCSQTPTSWAPRDSLSSQFNMEKMHRAVFNLHIWVTYGLFGFFHWAITHVFWYLSENVTTMQQCCGVQEEKGCVVCVGGKK